MQEIYENNHAIMEPTEEERAAYDYAFLLNSADVVIESKDDLEDNIKVDIACAMVSFSNSHLVANKLVKLDAKVANALCNELLNSLQENKGDKN